MQIISKLELLQKIGCPDDRNSLCSIIESLAFPDDLVGNTEHIVVFLVFLVGHHGVLPQAQADLRVDVHDEAPGDEPLHWGMYLLFQVERGLEGEGCGAEEPGFLLLGSGLVVDGDLLLGLLGLGRFPWCFIFLQLDLPLHIGQHLTE